MSDLPPGWIQTTLGEIADTSLGKMLDRGKSQGDHLVPYLRNSNVQWGRLELDDVLTMDISLEEQEFYGLLPGDLLVCEGGEIGRCAVWPGGPEYMAFQKALHRIRPHGGIPAKFFLYLLEYLSKTGMLSGFATGSTIKHLPQEQLRRLPVSLPPSAEQQRIVAALEDHLSRLEIGVRSLLAVDKRMGRLWQSALNRVVAGDVTSHERMPTVSVGEVAEVQGGIQKQPKRKPLKNKYPFLRVANVPRGKLDLDVIHEMELFDGELDRYRLRAGDLLVVEGNGEPGTDRTRCYLARRDRRLCSSESSYSGAARARIGSTISRTCVQFSGLTPVHLRNVASSNQRIADHAEYSEGQIRSNSAVSPLDSSPRRTRTSCRSNAVDKWRPHASLSVKRDSGQQRCAARFLRRHLPGRLVPQDPADEPASVLLERIRAQRAAQPKVRRETQDDETGTAGGDVAMSTADTRRLVAKLWNYCDVLRDDGVSTIDYVEQLTYLLFLKMAHERANRPLNPDTALRGRSRSLAATARFRRRRPGKGLPAYPGRSRPAGRDAGRDLPQGAEQDPGSRRNSRS